MRVQIPYGFGYQQLEVGEYPDVEILQSRVASSTDSEGDILQRAFERPIGTPPLWQLAQDKKTALVICSDHTRPVPSKLLIPPLLAQLRRKNPDIEVTLLIATGFHRAPTRRELADKFGERVVGEERILIHNCKDESALANAGSLPSGAPFFINRHAMETDLLVAEGFIEPHFFAGFSGGRKSVLPGICGWQTVMGNHCAAFIDDSHARTGVLKGNPMHLDMVTAAKQARLAFIANVVLDDNKKVAAAFCGDTEKAHRAGCDYLAARCRVTPSRPADIIVTSNGGAPLDQNLYQAVKCLTAAEAAAAPGAVIIAVAACGDGAGGAGFYTAMKNCESPQSLLAEIRGVPMEETRPDQWQVQILARILSEHRVIMVCEERAARLAGNMKLETAPDVAAAMAAAISSKGRDARITVIVDGVSVIVGPGGEERPAPAAG